MIAHLHGITNTAVVTTPTSIIIAIGTDQLELSQQAGNHLAAQISPKWEEVITMGHVAAKQLMLTLAAQIRAIEEANGEIKLPPTPAPGSGAKN